MTDQANYRYYSVMVRELGELHEDGMVYFFRAPPDLANYVAYGILFLHDWPFAETKSHVNEITKELFNKALKAGARTPHDDKPE